MNLFLNLQLKSKDYHLALLHLLHNKILIEKIKEVIPPAPTNPFIDLGQFKEHRVEEAILRSFNPEVIDQALRANPHHFERFRAAYDHPREFHAYQAIKADPEEFTVLQKLGFQVG